MNRQTSFPFVPFAYFTAGAAAAYFTGPSTSTPMALLIAIIAMALATVITYKHKHPLQVGLQALAFIFGGIAGGAFDSPSIETPLAIVIGALAWFSTLFFIDYIQRKMYLYRNLW